MRPAGAVRGMKGLEPLSGKRMVGIADVVSLDRKRSPSGLYVKGRYGIVPLDSLDEAKGRQVLARTEGLTLEQKRDLHEQGIRLLYIREAPTAPGNDIGIEAWYPTGGNDSHREQRERLDASEGPIHDELGYGTMIVPYLLLNDRQAESVQRMAQSLPLPREDPWPRTAPNDTPAACWWGFPGC